MSGSLFYLCAIPGPIWEQSVNDYDIDIASFAAGGLVCERRINKGINLDAEYKRYYLCCQRLEQEISLSKKLKQINNIREFHAILQDGFFPMQVLNYQYLELLKHTENPNEIERLGATYFFPYQVRVHRLAFEAWANGLGQEKNEVVQQRLVFLKAIEDSGCGLVELQSCFHPTTIIDVNIEEAKQSYTKRLITQASPNKLSNFAFSERVIQYFSRDKRKLLLARRFYANIVDALAINEPVSLDRQMPDDVIIETLHDLVFVPDKEVVLNRELRIVYEDGSEAKPFLLFCLPNSMHIASRTTAQALLRIGLISMRDTSLDNEVDLYWVRNNEFAGLHSWAEIDQFCFNTTLSQLSNKTDLKDLFIQQFHQRSLPATIGFYRGFVQVLIKSQMNLRVTPFYQQSKGHYLAGTDWG